MLTVHVIECSFYENSVNYLEPLGLEDVVPYQPGEGTVYIHGISIDFQQSIKFINNTGSGLAIVKAEVDFSDSIVSLSNNTGNRGGGIALLGAAYIIIKSQMLTVHIIECSFYENSVTYLEPLGLEDVVPYQPGEGTVYIHGISIDFQQSIKFINNTGSGLAIVKAEGQSLLPCSLCYCLTIR